MQYAIFFVINLKKIKKSLTFCNPKNWQKHPCHFSVVLKEINKPCKSNMISGMSPKTADISQKHMPAKTAVEDQQGKRGWSLLQE